MTLMTRSSKHVKTESSALLVDPNQTAFQVVNCAKRKDRLLHYVDRRISPGRTKGYVGTPWCLKKSHALITLKRLISINLTINIEY